MGICWAALRVMGGIRLPRIVCCVPISLAWAYIMEPPQEDGANLVLSALPHFRARTAMKASGPAIDGAVWCRE